MQVFYLSKLVSLVLKQDFSFSFFFFLYTKNGSFCQERKANFKNKMFDMEKKKKETQNNPISNYDHYTTCKLCYPLILFHVQLKLHSLFGNLQSQLHKMS